ncbi:MAG: RNA polymerase-binding protein DksA [Zetaproteobacteria bacterium]|nr:MAG: RNA polymerase-binding protein DksA [Zetaproteobacteria bacterium]
MALTAEELAQFEAQLRAWREELVAGQYENMHQLHEQELSAFPDPTDQATMETDRSFELRIKDRERKLIRKIDQALERIRNGEYGICEACGGDIRPQRLRARPVTTLCIECKSAQEQGERTHV